MLFAHDRGRSGWCGLYIESFDNFVTSVAVPIATGWNDQFAARVYLPLKISAFARRTPYCEYLPRSGKQLQVHLVALNRVPVSLPRRSQRSLNLTFVAILPRINVS